MRFKVCALAGCAVAIAVAQEFDIASVKPSEGHGKTAIGTTPGGVTIDGRFSDVVGWAYELKRYQVAGPDWITMERYRIIAKPGAAATVPEMRHMMQALLMERFQLKSHREDREMWVYAIVVAKGGTKVQVSDSEGEREEILAKKVGTGGTMRRTTMEQLADSMDGALGPEPIVDQTGLKGKYDFTLDLAGAMRGMQAGDLPSILTVGMEKQLGLSLQRKKMTIEVLVVDSAEKRPSEN